MVLLVDLLLLLVVVTLVAALQEVVGRVVVAGHGRVQQQLLGHGAALAGGALVVVLEVEVLGDVQQLAQQRLHALRVAAHVEVGERAQQEVVQLLLPLLGRRREEQSALGREVHVEVLLERREPRVELVEGVVADGQRPHAPVRLHLRRVRVERGVVEARDARVDLPHGARAAWVRIRTPVAPLDGISADQKVRPCTRGFVAWYGMRRLLGMAAPTWQPSFAEQNEHCPRRHVEVGKTILARRNGRYQKVCI
ncbi:hypothetical protein ON010_g12273 [Phytophthora cinnamomi]|nr:hypothetical protein ON010_g12273 [Phytophthora cinnamomi]